MESKLRHNRRRSGYEPSDTETDWVDSPRRETQNKGFDMQSRSRNPLDGVEGMQSSGIIVELEAPFSGSSRRTHSISPYKPRGEHSNALPLQIIMICLEIIVLIRLELFLIWTET